MPDHRRWAFPGATDFFAVVMADRRPLLARDRSQRLGLARDPTDWVWSSARFWEGWSDVKLRMDHPHE